MSKGLYVEVNGEGRDVVMLHGWGMHSGIWGEFKNLLEKNFRVHAIDLPGFGKSKLDENEFSLASVSKVIEDYINSINKQVSLIGWSLGGLFVMNILNNIKNVEKLVLIASSPCFTKKKNWDTGMEQSVFDEFGKNLEKDYEKTLQRFMSLQTRGSELARDELRTLKKKILERGQPGMTSLKGGLKILNEVDLRNMTNQDIHTLVILGEKDTLVPVGVIDTFKSMYPNMEQLIINKTGHAPFLTHAAYCAEKVERFINA